MRIFFGAAIQGLGKRGERSELYSSLIEAIKGEGHTVVSEHTTGGSWEETARKLEESIGPLPPVGRERVIYVRDKMISLIESDLGGAIFEASTPSLGTGVEIAHAYLRKRLGLKEIPILVLYQTDFWPNGLSSMVKGLTPHSAPSVQIAEFTNKEEASALVRDFLRRLA